MAIKISGTDVIDNNRRIVNVAAGTATAPSVSFTDDPDTGMYRPALNTLAFSTDGGERLRIDSNGNLLMGATTAPTGAVNSIVPLYRTNGTGGIIGPSIINTVFRSPNGAGTFTITLEADTILDIYLDVVVIGSFNTSDREGYAAYKVLCNRRTDSVTTITVQEPTNRQGSFTSGFTFTVTKPAASRLEIIITKPSGASYSIGLNGQSTRRTGLTSISSSFVEN